MVMRTHETYLYIGILNPFYGGKIVLNNTTMIIFEDFIKIFTGYETYNNAPCDEIIENSSKNPDKAYSFKGILFTGYLKIVLKIKLIMTPKIH
jgi:hypothetical protein